MRTQEGASSPTKMAKRTPQKTRSQLVKTTAVIRDFPDLDVMGHRKAVCKRCHCVMNDIESSTTNGEYWHPSRDKDGKPWRCINAGLKFTQADLEIQPFVRKAVRRRNHRNGTHA